MKEPARKVPTSYGDGAAGDVPGIARALQARRIMLVCGRRSFEASGAAAMLPGLEAVAEVHRWSDFAPNTDAADLAVGLALAAEWEPDLVLGVGGGSAMDMAKLLCGYGSTATHRLEATIREGGTIASRDRSLVLVPTTSGSGSEATHFAVVYSGEEKFSIAGPGMYADHIVLDPRLAMSGSAHQRATSGIDAVCQAVESLWAAAASPWSRRRARRALDLLLPAIETFVNRPDIDSARAMSIGSHLAGKAIDVSRTTAAHALSYAITKGYGVNHGSAVALTLGAFIDAHSAADPADLQATVDRATHLSVMEEIRSRLGAAAEGTARERFNALLREIDLPASLGEVGIGDEPGLRRLAESVNVERLGNNPVRYGDDALYRILLASA